MASIAREAAKSFAVVNERAIASIAESVRGIDTIKLVDLSPVKGSLSAFAEMNPLVAPQMGQQIAEALRIFNEANAAKIRDVFKMIDPPVFKFAKSLDPEAIAALMPRFEEAFKTLKLPPTFSESIGEALRSAPTIDSANLAPVAVGSIEDAVVLSDSSAAKEIAQTALPDTSGMSPEKRYEIQERIAEGIAALVAVIAIMVRSARFELASALLVLVTVLVSLHRRLNDPG